MRHQFRRLKHRVLWVGQAPRRRDKDFKEPTNSTETALYSQAAKEPGVSVK